MGEERIPDDAVVIRGGRNRPDDIRRGTGTHPSGVSGVSVECALGVPLGELAALIPHSHVGVTSVGQIRAASGDVVRTSGRSRHRAGVGTTPPQGKRTHLPRKSRRTRSRKSSSHPAWSRLFLMPILSFAFFNIANAIFRTTDRFSGAWPSRNR